AEGRRSPHCPTRSKHSVPRRWRGASGRAFPPPRRRLRESARRPAEIRRRAFPVEPDELRRLLGPLEGDPVTLLCTTAGGERQVFVVRQLRS
ncbi:MAG: hypothetical protein ACE5EF_09965, partial [Dehalococcoidia bacterium]